MCGIIKRARHTEGKDSTVLIWNSLANLDKHTAINQSWNFTRIEGNVLTHVKNVGGISNHEKCYTKAFSIEKLHTWIP